jgi:hypothetical protein
MTKINDDIFSVAFMAIIISLPGIVAILADAPLDIIIAAVVVVTIELSYTIAVIFCGSD